MSETSDVSAISRHAGEGLVSGPRYINRLRYVGLGVRDLGLSRAFYSAFGGLELLSEDDQLIFLRPHGSSEPFSLRLRADSVNRLDIIGLGAGSRPAVDELARRLLDLKVGLLSEPADLPQPTPAYGFRFLDPDGRVVEVSSVVPGALEDSAEVQTAASRPNKLSHVVLNSPDLSRIVDFYVSALGFRISDWLGDRMAFLRCSSQHHSLAFNAAPHTSVNHTSWELPDVPHFMRATGNFMREGVRPVWGPGWHGPGDSGFAYFLDPSEFTFELTTPLTLIEDENTWIPHEFSTDPEHSDLWGTGGGISPQYISAVIGRPDPGVGIPPPL